MAAPYRALAVACLAFACGPAAPKADAGQTNKAAKPTVDLDVRTGKLCDHTRELMGEGHGQRLDNAKYAELRAGCIHDFRVQEQKWGAPMYRTFLSCGLAAKDMQTLLQCHERAEHHAGQPAAPTGAAPAVAPALPVAPKPVVEPVKPEPKAEPAPKPKVEPKKKPKYKMG